MIHVNLDLCARATASFYIVIENPSVCVVLEFNECQSFTVIWYHATMHHDGVEVEKDMIGTEWNLWKQ